MKRSTHLEPLSHDHYTGLLVAGRILQGLQRDASPDVIVAYVAHFWESHLAGHFEEEERLLLPLLGESEEATLGERMVEEHRRILYLLTRVRNGGENVTSDLAELARTLKAHIRFEERELFPALERQAPEAALREVGEHLEATHLEADPDWGPRFWNESAD